MIEILLLVYLCTKMGKLLRAKGWKPIWMQVFVVFGWFAAMFTAAVAYSVYVAIIEGPEAMDEIGFEIYPWALLGAALSQGVLFGIAWLLRDRTKPPELGFRETQQRSVIREQ